MYTMLTHQMCTRDESFNSIYPLRFEPKPLYSTLLISNERKTFFAYNKNVQLQGGSSCYLYALELTNVVRGHGLVTLII